MTEFIKLIQTQFEKMSSTGKLFRSSVTGQQVWELYINGFTEKENPIFRDPNSSTKNCNLCKNFIRRYGNIVAIDENYNIITLFDINPSEDYINVSKKISAKLKANPIENVFFETYNELNSLPYESCTKNNKLFKLGVDKNRKIYSKEEAILYGVVKEGEVRTFNHFHLYVPNNFVDLGSESVESIMANYRDAKNVFQRAMEDIPLDTLNLVSDLIKQNSLLNGETHLFKIKEIIPLKTQYDTIDSTKRDNWCWLNSYKLKFAKFKNELIGVLCTELAEGKELNDACLSWNKRVDPANYMKASAPITQFQINEARKFVEDNGYAESFDRRLANIDDIKASDIKHINVGDGKIKAVSIFDNIKSTSTRHKRSEFDKIDVVSIDKFMEDIISTCSSIEVYFENRMSNNLVTLTTANNPDSKPIFKWANNYSWTFNGNLAGKSELREAVSLKGGRVDGAFRFSHSWNELEPNQSLMDLHVFMPGCNHSNESVHNTYGDNNNRVGWNHRNETKSGGTQDVDYTAAASVGYIPVENITFPNINKMPNGKYVCKIHNWTFRTSGGRGKAEIEFDGNIYQYEYPATKHHQWITVAEVTLKDGIFSIEHKLPETNSSKKIYNLDTNQFHKVNLVCLSPNHWGENQVGNKHYMFMINDCKVEDSIRSFHAENLLPELAQHRKVLEVLGNTNMIEPIPNGIIKQLSGIGFNATVRDELIVRLQGTHKRVIKIQF